MAFRSIIKPHNTMVPVRSLFVILEKLLTTYIAGFNHLYDIKSREILLEFPEFLENTDVRECILLEKWASHRG